MAEDLQRQIDEIRVMAEDALDKFPIRSTTTPGAGRERHIHDLGKHLGGVIAARVYNSAAIAVANNTDVYLTFDSERFDTDTIHSTSSNTGRLTCKTAGKYIITSTHHWETNTTERRTLCFIRWNGSTRIAEMESRVTTGGNVSQNITTIYDLAVDDYVEIGVSQGSGVELDVLAASNYSPEFMMSRVGAAGTTGGGVPGTDHGALNGLGDDDHTSYVLAAGTRAGSTASAQDFGSTGIKADVIAESGGGNGVTADGVLLKDSEVTTDVINEKTSAAGVTIDGLLIMDNFIEHEEIPTPANPALNNLRLFARASGTNIQLIALSSQGAECVICTLDDTAVAHTNTLTLNWIE
jgi:hypothetical protein